MKKILALVLSLMMILVSIPAMAENIEDYFEGTWVQFEDGFEIYLPSEWLELEVTEEQNAQGIFYVVCSPDQTKMMQLGWSGLDAEIAIEDLQAALAETIPAELVEVNGIQLLCAGDAENDSLMFIGMDAAEPGYYIFVFTPMSDTELQAYASVIAASLRNIE